MPKYDVTVKLVGNDGNAFAILGSVGSALKKAGASKDEVNTYVRAATAGDYNHLIRTTMDWVNVT